MKNLIADAENRLKALKVQAKKNEAFKKLPAATGRLSRD